MTTAAQYENLITLPVPEGGLVAVQEDIREAIAEQTADGRPIGVEQEYPVYRAAAQSILGMLTGQRIQYAADLSKKLDAAAAGTDGAVDIYSVAAQESQKLDFEHRAEGVDLPTNDERLVALAHAVGTTAHAIAAVELAHVSAPANIERAEKALDKPGVRTDIGSIPNYTLHTLLDELKSANPAENHPDA